MPSASHCTLNALVDREASPRPAYWPLSLPYGDSTLAYAEKTFVPKGSLPALTQLLGRVIVCRPHALSDRNAAQVPRSSGLNMGLREGMA